MENPLHTNEVNHRTILGDTEDETEENVRNLQIASKKSEMYSRQTHTSLWIYFAGDDQKAQQKSHSKNDRWSEIWAELQVNHIRCEIELLQKVPYLL